MQALFSGEKNQKVQTVALFFANAAFVVKAQKGKLMATAPVENVPIVKYCVFLPSSFPIPCLQ